MENFKIVYLSESGVGETIAERLFKECKEKKLDCKIFSAEKFRDIDWKESKLYFFICSSTGDGDPPEKSVKFWRWLRTSAPKDLMKDCQIALLALGDSNYSSYMQMPRRLHKSLIDLGATDLIAKKEADDATPTGLESAVEPWLENVLSTLTKLKHKNGDNSNETSSVLSNEQQKYPKLAKIGFEVTQCENVQSLKTDVEEGSISLIIGKGRYLTSEKAIKSVLHITFEGDGIPHYIAGDAFCIRCPNSIEDVEYVLGSLKECERGVIESKETEFWPRHVPNPVDVFQALSWYVDLAALPTKRLLRALAECCSLDKDKQSLLDYCEISNKGKENYAKLAEKRYGLVRLLKEHPSCVPPLNILLSMLPVLKQRSYSVASMRKEPASVDIAFVVVRDEEFMGCCTNWLLRLCELQKKIEGGIRPIHHFDETKKELLQKQINHVVSSKHKDLSIPIRFRPPISFRFPEKKLTVPLIMIGPGTGVAPFVGFCQTIQHLRNDDKSCFPENHLFFGCRDRKLDFLYREELEFFEKEGTLTKLHVASSRETDKKVYVQHLLDHQAQYIANALIHRGGFLYICGDARNMVPDVVKAIICAFEQHGNLKSEEAKAVLEKMKQEKRYEIDCWA